MKKTLITMLALCSVSLATAATTLDVAPDVAANAATTANSVWQGFITDFNDVSGINSNEFTLNSFSFTSHGSATKINDIYFAIYEVDASSADTADYTYTLVGTSALGSVSGNNWNFGSISGTTAGSSLTLSSTGIYAFILQNNGTSAVASGSLSQVVTNATWTKRFGIYNADTESVDNGLDGKNFAISGGALTADRTGVVSYNVTVPEPATATLSLLALAGLAARRRRK